MELNTPGQKGISTWINKHTLLMILCCVAPIAIIFTFLALGISNSFLSYAVVLICPLSMVLMMLFMHKYILFIVLLTIQIDFIINIVKYSVE